MLKEDYKDALFEDQRKYNMKQNSDGTISLVDVTKYTQEGDRFGAKDINNTNAEINKMQQVKIVDLTLNGWSESYPYSQAVAVTGIKDTDAPILSLYLPQGLNAIAVKAKNKAFSCLYRAVSGSERITFYAYKKPETDFQVSVKGV